MTEASHTVPPTAPEDRARFLFVFNVPRAEVDMEALQQRLCDVIDLGGFAWDFAIGFAPREGARS